MFITFIFLANILLLVQPSEGSAYRGHTNDEIRLMDECSDEPHIQERLGKDDYMSLIDACTWTKSCMKNLTSATMFITFIFLANILLLVQPTEGSAYRGHTNDEIRLMDECSDEPYIQERLGKDDYMSLIDACVERRLAQKAAGR
ncbi:hypothetical protein T03_17709 [Trichinella britovi]|uniref:Uncharacterized protein n=1 Tax=Trichinella britovi TaxID=45882 RepID=A0A0V1DF71_TRIBR|nr:hypothetical protein T03_17709 [Trichinella britovi]